MQPFLDFLTVIAPYAITGSIVSAVVQFVKPIFDASNHKLLLVAGVSILAGVALQFVTMIPSNVYETVLIVFAAANTVYLVLLKRFNPQ